MKPVVNPPFNQVFVGSMSPFRGAPPLVTPPATLILIDARFSSCSPRSKRLDHGNIDILFKQMRGEAVPQRMWPDALFDPRAADTEGPNHPWRSPHPKARPAQNK